jgi:hypothetical protein
MITTTDQTVSVATQKLTFHEAVDQLLAESELKKIDTTDGWARALNVDLARLGRILDNLAQDLSLISGRKVVCESKMELKSLTGDFDSLEDRVRAVSKEFQDKVPDFVQTVLANLKSVEIKGFSGVELAYTFPLEHIGKNNIKGDSLRFHFTDDVGHKAYNIRLAGFSFVCPDDFPKRVPDRVKQKLDLLPNTTYRYDPKILEGILIEKKLVVLQTTRPIGEFDPGLVLSLGGDYGWILCDYWTEPVNEEELKTKKRLHNWEWTFTHPAAIWGGPPIIAILTLLFAKFTSSVPYHLWWNTPLCAIATLTIIHHIAMLFNGIQSDHFRDLMRQEYHRFIAKRSLTI